MPKSKISSDKRAIFLRRERMYLLKKYQKCPLCGALLTNETADRHELIRRMHLPVEYCPLVFRVMLCSSCNLDRADAAGDRMALVKVNAAIYSSRAMRDALKSVFDLHRTHRVPMLPEFYRQQISQALDDYEKENNHD